jgi:hypothetical protein
MTFKKLRRQIAGYRAILSILVTIPQPSGAPGHCFPRFPGENRDPFPAILELFEVAATPRPFPTELVRGLKAHGRA